MSKSKIEWLRGSDGVEGKTWNPVTGCTKISTGCQNCYAERMAKRLKAMGQAKYLSGFAVQWHPDVLDEPLRWKKPRMVFVGSMGDLFHKDVPDEFINHVFIKMSYARQHTFQVLTKRIHRVPSFLKFAKREGYVRTLGLDLWPDNVWLGTSVENQEAADERIPHLLQTPATVRFLSLEPLLSGVDLAEWLFYDDGPACCDGGTQDNPCGCHGVHQFLPVEGNGIDWVIVGGESGPGARLVDWHWVRDIRDQCVAAGVPFFFKGWGGVNKKKSGRILESRTWDEMPTNRSTT